MGEACKGSWATFGSDGMCTILMRTAFTSVHLLKFTVCTLNRHRFLYVNYNSPKLLKFYQSNDPCEQMGEKEDLHNKGTLVPEQIRARRLFLAKVCLLLLVVCLDFPQY